MFRVVLIFNATASASPHALRRRRDSTIDRQYVHVTRAMQQKMRKSIYTCDMCPSTLIRLPGPTFYAAKERGMTMRVDYAPASTFQI